MYSLIRKILFTLQPETAHLLIKSFSKCIPKGGLRRSTTIKSKLLKSSIGQTPLKNPIGLAAGFDKNGEMISFLQALGFGFLELGSITAQPCAGNPKPRIFRLTKDQSLINRMGLPNMGADAFAKHMTKQKTIIPYGVNIAKTPNFAQNKDQQVGGIEDFITSFQRLHFLGNYTVFNLSCPNTNESKTFEDPNLFTDLAQEIASVKKALGSQKPLFIKLSPDLETNDLRKIVETAIKFDFDGFVIANTTIQRSNLQTPQRKIEKIGSGGLSGQALNHLANEQLKKVYEIVGQNKILIGVGGVMNFQDVLTRNSYWESF